MNQDLMLSDGKYQESDCIFWPEVLEQCGKSTTTGRNTNQNSNFNTNRP